MKTKWVTPLFLSVLSFMINTQNVCAMSKQGQEQRFAGTFQTEIQTVNHQTTLSSKNEATVQMPSQGPVDSLEDLLSHWDKLILQVKQQVNAGDEDFQLFTNFNRSYIDSEWAALFQLIKYRKVNYGNISSYLSPQKQKLETLYANFLQIKKEYPSSLEPFRHPRTTPPLPVGCNAACTNMDFATGNFSGWNGYYGVNNSTTLAHAITGITGGVLGAVVRGSKDLATSNTYQVHITSAGNKDWFLSNYHGINMSQASPWGTGYSAMIGDSINNGKGVAVLSQEFEVTPTTNSITYAYSVFLENPAHSYYQQPFFSVVLFDQNGDTIQNCGVYNVVSGSNIPGFTGEYYPPDSHETSGGAGGDTIYWRPWTQVNVPLTNYVGQCVTIQFEVGDCALGGHCGYAYVDASCSTFTITASSPVICHNGTDNLTGPAGETHYVWLGPANGIITNDTLQTITIDSGGTYTLVVTPVTGGLCKDTLTITIPGDKITATATTGNSCSGIAGSATATALNGYAPYTYAWLPSGGTNTIASGLSNGTYSVIITDTYGCEASVTTTITQSPALTESATTLSNVDCSGGDGSAGASASGGRSPYNYVWSPSGITTANATGLSAGNYTVTVTDANGCTASTTITITQPAILTAATSTASNVSCNGDANGSANIIANGGTSPYNYLWNPSGITTANATGLSAGNYTVTVTDANGCTVNSTTTITQPEALNASVTILSNVSCNGDANGSASIIANGGTSPYNYLWNPSGITTANATGLSAGNYSVIVTDANGCTLTSAVVTITQPFALSAATNTVNNISCNGNDNGSADVSATGGTAPYIYIWNPSGQTTETATGLSAGNYSVIVTDAHGCSVTSSATTITQPLVLNASAVVLANVSCNGSNNASASVSVNGGTSPYNYLWNPSGQVSATANGLSAGVYSITVTDAHGCTASSTVTVTQPAILSASTSTATNVSCNGDNNGSASVSASGGTIPYRYLWNPSGQADATAVGLSAGVYTVTVTDANGCTSIETATITQPLALVSSITFVSNVSCNGNNNASASISVSGGTSPYRYLWNPSGQTTATATGLSAGIYIITVTDAHGCSTTQQIVITQPEPLTVVLTGSQNFACKGQPQQISALVSGGTLPYTYNWSTGNNTSSITVIPIAASTTYTVIITDANGCSITGATTILLRVLSASTGPNNTICSGQSATLTVYASGGGGDYSYRWLPGGDVTISITVTPTITTIYTVIITDACSSTDTAYETVVVNPIPNMNFQADVNAGCATLCVEFNSSCTISSGSITEWTWNFGDGSQSNSKSAVYCYPNAGQYEVTLTATTNLGCSATLEKPNYITVYATPKAEFVASPQPTTIRNPLIQFTNQTPGQDNIAIWLWNFGATGDSNSSNAINPFHRYTDTGTYKVSLTVMSIHGCTDTVAHDVVISPDFTLYFPNAFTPNGDGLNDTFYPKGTYVKTFEMYIYDRWGNELFHTTDMNQGWDGRVHGSGNISQEDVYVYIATATDVEGETYNYTGKVTLLK